MQSDSIRRKSIAVEGRVQGVGFRPHVWRLAASLGLTGFVGNSSAGVIIEAQGTDSKILEFEKLLLEAPPPLSIITESNGKYIDIIKGEKDFRIKKSVLGASQKILVSPDMSVCRDCLNDVRSIGDPRYAYPFANCTNCGPRFTITEALPYDRARTTMRCFPLCDRCEAEYNNPDDRRFHAQPVACPDCGPRIWYADKLDPNLARDPRRALEKAAALVNSSGVLALKGLGGFQLLCDARSDETIERLRALKDRPHKPFAVMTGSVEDAKRFCEISEREEELLKSQANPITLLAKRADPQSPLSPLVAPDTGYIGVMLPTTPLHALLLDSLAEKGAEAPCLVATSGNPPGEPICLSCREASAKLGAIADGTLFHDRDILVRVDDSVAFVSPSGAPSLIRRARGYAPAPVRLRDSLSGVLGMGAMLKSTFCLTRDNYAFLSQHIGDLDSPSSREFFESALSHLETLLETKPRAIVRDLHPDFLSSRMAIELAGRRDLPLLSLQHHAAHAFAVLAEHGVYEPSLALCLDGSGLGVDASIWGGEILSANLETASWERLGSLSPFPLAGGETAIREPWRLAAALATKRPPGVAERDYNIIREMIAKNINITQTSSAGRLFDAVAALLGLCHKITYEGQAAIRLENAAGNWERENSGREPVDLFSPEEIILSLNPFVADARKIFERCQTVFESGRESGELAAAFHRDLAKIFCSALSALAESRDEKKIALCGGVFNNRILTRRVLDELNKRGLSPLLPSLAPPGDGAISLGQAAWGQRMILTKTVRLSNFTNS